METTGPSGPTNNHTPTNDFLLDSIRFGNRDSTHGVTKGRKDDVEKSFAKWVQFTAECEIDTFLCTSSFSDKVNIFSGFAYRLRHNFAGHTTRDELRGLSIRREVFNVSEAFQSYGHPDPIRFGKGLSTKLARQIRGYITADPPPIQQAPLPLSIFENVLDMAISSGEKGIADLICSALFFGMRSCEYTDTPGMQHKRTTILELRDIRFYDKNRDPITHKSLTLSRDAKIVSVRFRRQKNQMINEMVIQHRTNSNTMCPVLRLAAIVQRIWSYPNTTKFTSINTLLVNTKLVRIKAKTITKTLRHTVTQRGQHIGVNQNSIGTHSIRTSFAMLMQLNGAHETTIMKKGRWLSSAFLRYIRGYIDQFGGDSSTIIIGPNGEFKSLLGHGNI